MRPAYAAAPPPSAKQPWRSAAPMVTTHPLSFPSYLIKRTCPQTQWLQCPTCARFCNQTVRYSRRTTPRSCVGVQAVYAGVVSRHFLPLLLFSNRSARCLPHVAHHTSHHERNRPTTSPLPVTKSYWHALAATMNMPLCCLLLSRASVATPTVSSWDFRLRLHPWPRR
jgi:hypothetical protein